MELKYTSPFERQQGIIVWLLNQSYAELVEAKPELWEREKENWEKTDRDVFKNPDTIGACTFKHKGLEDFHYTGSKRGIKPEHANRLGRILDRLNAASETKDMNYPGSFLHQLSGDKKGFHAVKVSGNWRIIFQFIDDDAYIVDYDDYH